MTTQSPLKAVFNLKYEHPTLVQILELYMDLTKMGRRLSLSGSLAMWALEEIWQQTQQLRMPLLATSRLNSSHFLTENPIQTLTCGSWSGMSSRKIKYIKYFQTYDSVLLLLEQTEKRKLCWP